MTVERAPATHKDQAFARPAEARLALREWQNTKPDNAYRGHPNLQRILRRYLGERLDLYRPTLEALGEEVVAILDPAARQDDLPENHPRLLRYSAFGDRIEQVRFHPTHDLLARAAWNSGIMALQSEAGQATAQMGLYTLLLYNGEHGQACSLGCASGLARALQNAGSNELKQRWLPGLLSGDYDTRITAAEFLSEVQGGSDVGANSLSARAQADGTVTIHGEKWFCSNVNADLFVISARPEGGPPGTRGLGCFVVPRVLEDGRTNEFYLRRLKDKLGTRSLASAEVDFCGARAYQIGTQKEGFHILAGDVLNTARLMLSVGCAAIMHRSFVEASTFARKRRAFGNTIVDYPLVQETLADILTESHAATSASFYLASLLDQIETGRATDDEKATFRLLLNVVKYRTTSRASQTIHQAMEVMGGNAAIEDFSVLPRLYRDAFVYENWEGTHNTIAMQVLRDIAKYRIHDGFLRTMQAKIAKLAGAGLDEHKPAFEAMVGRVGERLSRFSGSPRHAAAHARRFVDGLADLAQATLLAEEVLWEREENLESAKPEILTHFLGRTQMAGTSPENDPDFLRRISVLAAQVG